MVNKVLELKLNDIKSGYMYDEQNQIYVCNICGKKFDDGEVYPFEDRYFRASSMVKKHIASEHGEVFRLLCSNEKKYTGITDNQKELLNMIYAGLSDKEIATRMGVAASTIRHQRFVFREKAKQAKMFLAIYELAIEGSSKKSDDDKLIKVHSGARMVDDRYFITEAEREKTLKSMFISLEPLKLKSLPSKEKKKIVVLQKIVEQFDKNRKYSEKELNNIIKEVYHDFATIRRYFIEYGFMKRTIDCKEYWIDE